MKFFLNLPRILYFLLGMLTIIVILFLHWYLQSHNYFSLILFVTTKDRILPFLIYEILTIIILTYFYYKIVNKHPTTKKGLRLVYIFLLISFTLSYFIVTYESLHNLQTSLAMFISSIFLGTGWWVQAMITNASTKRTHTLNVIMNQRNNSEFHKRTQHARKYLSKNKVINKELFEYYNLINTNKNSENFLNKEIRLDFINQYKNDKDKKDKIKNAKQKREELSNMIKAIDSLNYQLNYYEFIAAGVNSGDLDSELISYCFSGILCNLERRAFYLILPDAKKAKAQNTQNYIFCELLSLIDKCGKDKSIILKTIRENPNGDDTYSTHDLLIPEEKIYEYFAEK